MVISYFGKKFLKFYNEKENKNLKPKEFFTDVFLPIFHGGKKSLMYIINSPFDNPSNKKKSNDEKIKLFFEKIYDGGKDASIFVGGYVNGFGDTTSYNIATEFKHNIDEDEIYYSWIGHALGLNIKGLSFLFDNNDILFLIYEGWLKYHELLNDPLYEKYKSNQIQTWNSHYILNVLSTYPKKNFNPFDENKLSFNDENNEKNEKKLVSPPWTRILFHVSKKNRNNSINAYVYKLGQTNETYGNVTIEINEFKTFLEFCDGVFGENHYINNPDIYDKIFGNGRGMETICELGTIGLFAIKPELFLLEEKNTYNKLYNNKEKNRYNNLYKEAIKDENYFKLYNLYIMTKLKIKDVDKTIVEFATELINFKQKTKINSDYLFDELLKSTNLTNFLENVTEIINKFGNDPIFEKIGTFFINNENFKDILIFLKYHYTIIKNKN